MEEIKPLNHKKDTEHFSESVCKAAAREVHMHVTVCASQWHFCVHTFAVQAGDSTLC